MSQDSVERRIAALDAARLPRHVAVIMDGNGRWALRRGLARTLGHERGIEAVRATIRTARRANIPYLTLYAFSLENWRRPAAEVNVLMRLLVGVLDREIAKLIEHDIRLAVIGRLDRLTDQVRAGLDRALARTAGGKAMTLTIALSYSGRDEIVRAARALATEAANGTLAPESIDEAAFAARLDTAGLPDPDLLIRTSGERRLSNYLLWQLAYAELTITDTLWPDFDGDAFVDALEDYARRERRFGGVTAPPRGNEHG